MLEPVDPQPLQARTLNVAVPRREFLECQIIALAHFVDRQQAAMHGRDDFRLAPRDPACGAWRRKAFQRQRLAQGPDHLRWPDCLVLEQDSPRNLARKGGW